MGSSLRRATHEDTGTLAYLVLKWDAELPHWLRTIGGDAQAAQRTATLMCSSDSYDTWLVERNGECVGAMCIHTGTSLFGFHTYGQMCGVYVLPQHRGWALYGLRLLRKAMELKRERGWKWLEMSPWADDVNMGRVLRRLGFFEATHMYALR